MKTFLQQYGQFKIHSQQGEEGIVKECFQRMGITGGTVCEFGAHNGKYCSNSRLFLEAGFNGLLIEADRGLFAQLKNCALPGTTLIHEFVTPDNVNELLKDLPADFDLLSIDTDSNDHDIWKALTLKPKIVIIEIDSCYAPHEPGFNSAGGATYKTMVELGIEKGYFLICHTGNLIFCDNKYRELFPDIIGDGLYNSEEYFNKSWLHYRHQQ
jgi:hypothetical protein